MFEKVFLFMYRFLRILKFHGPWIAWLSVDAVVAQSEVGGDLTDRESVKAMHTIEP